MHICDVKWDRFHAYNPQRERERGGEREREREREREGYGFQLISASETHQLKEK